jgi:uncharacterized protein
MSTIELKPLGNSCNLACTYCYQEPMRLAGNTAHTLKYDIDLMIKLANEAQANTSLGQSTFTLFGGEALLVPKKDLERFFEHGLKNFGVTYIQTNGSLIDDDHIRLFKEYNVWVGISVDGHEELNDLRKPKSAKQDVREATRSTINNIERLVNEGVGVGIIATLHQLNGSKDKLPKFIEFVEWLSSIGIKEGNLHMLEVDSEEAEKHMLSEDENTEAFLTLAKFFEKNPSLRWSPFTDFPTMLRGRDAVGCVWHNCDASNTQSVYGVEGEGSITNCGMVNKDGVDWTKDEGTSYTRDLILYATPHEDKGCKGCPYFMMCNGYCPGSAIDGDWRNKTMHCKTLKTLFSFYERKLEFLGITPVTKDDRMKEMEEFYINQLANGYRSSVQQAIEHVEQVNPYRPNAN